PGGPFGLVGHVGTVRQVPPARTNRYGARMAKTATALELPPLTTDLEEAKGHLDHYGVARIADALDAEQLAALRSPPTEQAAGERGGGIAFCDSGGANQRLWNLPSKGEVFCNLLRTPVVGTLVRHVLGGDYCLSSHTANIAGPGGTPQVLHTDQGYAPRA